MVYLVLFAAVFQVIFLSDFCFITPVQFSYCRLNRNNFCQRYWIFFVVSPHLCSSALYCCKDTADTGSFSVSSNPHQLNYDYKQDILTDFWLFTYRLFVVFR